MDPAVTGIGQVLEVVWVVRVRPATPGDVVVDVRSQAAATAALTAATGSGIDDGARVRVLPRVIDDWFQSRFHQRFRGTRREGCTQLILETHDGPRFFHSSRVNSSRNMGPTRSRARSTFRGSRSMPIAWCPRPVATARVVPLPPNGSSTTPGRQ